MCLNDCSSTSVSSSHTNPSSWDKLKMRLRSQLLGFTIPYGE
nr:MAG TPA: hypothetical protein [Caudoviricetes sp.]